MQLVSVSAVYPGGSKSNILYSYTALPLEKDVNTHLIQHTISCHCCASADRSNSQVQLGFS